MDATIIKKYLDKQKIKVVEFYDFEDKKVKYSDKITGWKIEKFRGDEEIVRAYILAKLVNELGYKPENIELEKQYDIGRPKVNKPRIDIIVKDDTALLITVRDSRILSLPCLPSPFCPRWIPKTL
jgi:type I restriction enzyme M protein